MCFYPGMYTPTHKDICVYVNKYIYMFVGLTYVNICIYICMYVNIYL